MTELTEFLTAIYDSFSEAELQALEHGQKRLAELLADDTLPDDIAVPVYHAGAIEVTLDVGLVLEETSRGMEVHVTETSDEEATNLSFSVDLLELLEEGDLDERDLKDILGNQYRPSASGSSNTKPSSNHWDRASPIGIIEGMDQPHEAELAKKGVTQLGQLLEHSSEELADIVASGDDKVSEDDAKIWLDEATALSTLLTDHEGHLPVEFVDGIGPTYGKRLRDGGISDLADLAAASPEEIAELVSTGELSVSPARATGWREQAEVKLEERTIEDTNDTKLTEE